MAASSLVSPATSKLALETALSTISKKGYVVQAAHCTITNVVLIKAYFEVCMGGDGTGTVKVAQRNEALYNAYIRHSDTIRSSLISEGNAFPGVFNYYMILLYDLN
jgi:hypothetical protein